MPSLSSLYKRVTVTRVISLSCDCQPIGLRRLFFRVTFMLLLLLRVQMSNPNRSSTRLEMESGKGSDSTHSPSGDHLRMLALSHQLEAASSFCMEAGLSRSSTSTPSRQSFGFRENSRDSSHIRRSVPTDELNNPNSPIEELSPDDEYVMEFARRCAEYPGRKPVLADIQSCLPPQQQGQLPVILVGLEQKG